MAAKKQSDSGSPEEQVQPNFDVKSVIVETIRELHADDAIQVQKPKTLQGWLYVIGGITAIIGVLWTGVVKLNDIAKHAEEPHHAGVEVLVERFQEAQVKHTEDRDLHRSEAELQLAIMKQTKPIEENLHAIKQDVREIQRSVDILVEDNRRRKNGNP